LNARDAIGEQSQGQIHIATRMSEDGQSVQAWFKDNGPGITEKDKARIFEPFFTTKPRGRGTGLGLYISQMIIANHHGTIEVESELGDGATFIVSLPVANS
jgi:signal transduction histidine kinase